MTSPIPTLDHIQTALAPAAPTTGPVRPAAGTELSPPKPTQSDQNQTTPADNLAPLDPEPELSAGDLGLPASVSAASAPVSARPVLDVELPAFEPMANANAAQSVLEPENEPIPPAQRSGWTSENPAFAAPCCRKPESSYVPRRPGKDQFLPSDPAVCESDHLAADPPPTVADPESARWPEPIGRAEQVLML